MPRGHSLVNLGGHQWQADRLAEQQGTQGCTGGATALFQLTIFKGRIQTSSNVKLINSWLTRYKDFWLRR